MPADSNPPLPPEVIAHLRRLAHDLSNAIETMLQASYLLAQAQLDEPSRKWVALIDQAAQHAARINRELRDTLKRHSPAP